MIILVSGPSGVGKTTLAKNISNQINVPVLHKDHIKEILFDTLGSDDLETTKSFRAVSWRLFYAIAEELIAKDCSVILEGNYKASIDEKTIANFVDKYQVNIVQVLCTADIDVLVKRFFGRINNERHPGHNDTAVSETDLICGIKKEVLPMQIDIPLIELDMNDFSLVDYESLYTRLGVLINH